MLKISIITCTFNSAKYIEKNILNVQNQNFKNIECIYVDGGSTDKTINIIQKYQDGNIKLISEKDDGIYDAMNKGIKVATGDIVGILNSDDFYEDSTILSTVMDAFNDSTIDGVYGNISYFSDDTEKITRYWRSGEYSESKLNSGWTIPHPTLFLRKSIYEKYGFFNTDFHIAADYELILRLLKIHKIKVKYIPKVFVRMYDGGTSASSLSQRIKGWKELKKAWTVNNLQIPNFFITRRILFKLSQYFK